MPETHFGAEIIHETGCFAIVQGPLAQLSLRVCPTACWAIGKQLVSQINLMMVSCVLNTPWGITVLAGSYALCLSSATESVVTPNS